MATKTFARINDGRVAEILRTDHEIEELFHRSLLWVEVTDTLGVAVGWVYDGSDFSSPSADTIPAGPSISELEVQLRSLEAQIAARKSA